MPLTPEQVAEQAMLLPAPSRADLAEKLVESLSEADLTNFQKLWMNEALRRRDDEVRSGKVQPIDGDQVLSDVRRAVGR